MSSWRWPARPDGAWVKTRRGWQRTARRVAGNLVVPTGEVWILEGLTVQGTITVEPGATLHAINVVITGRVECSNDSAVSLVSCTLRGSLLSLPGRRSPGADRATAQPVGMDDDAGRARNGDTTTGYATGGTADSPPGRAGLPACVVGHVHLMGTTVDADIRAVATAAVRSRPMMLLGPGTEVRGCVLVAGVDVMVEGATIAGPIWRTDADPGARGVPLLTPAGIGS